MLTPTLIRLKFLSNFALANHHSIKGPTFLADHPFLGDLYSAYDSAFDKLLERAKGLGEPVNENDIRKKAEAIPLAISEDPSSVFNALLGYESALRDALVEANGSASLGTQNLLAQFADDSEARTYLIGQRAK